MRITFVWPSSAQYTGGVVVLYRLADALAERGASVCFVHGPKTAWRIDDPAEITWHQFHPAVEHRVVDAVDDPAIPVSDIVMVADAPEHLGLRCSIIQGHRMVLPEWERQAFRFRGLKVVVASWLADIGAQYGVPAEQMVHVPCGIDHDLFHQTVDLDDRPIDVTVLYNRHPSKGWKIAERALTSLRARRPDLRVQAFSVVEPTHDLPPWIDVRIAPDRSALAQEIFNRSKVLLQASWQEGFGLTAVEAMACGAALVTTDNGGSRDYAVDGETALVRPPGDAAGLADAVDDLLGDPGRRHRLAAAGRDLVADFTWARAGERLHQHLSDYLADPARFQGELGPDRYEAPSTPDGWKQEVIEVESFTASASTTGAGAPAPTRSRSGARPPREEDLVWNVVWTGTVFDRLRYFVASQMAHSRSRFRFIANGCAPGEIDKMEAFRARHPDRVVEVLPVFDDMKAHGQALDAVLDCRDDGPCFSIIDPDIKASGPFAAELLALLPGHGAVSSGKEVWNRDSVVPEGHPGIAGEFFFDADGFVYGSPHLAIYDREALDETRARWGVGLGAAGPDIGAEAVARLEEFGRHFLIYDTAKVVNILLSADGHPLVHRDLPYLLHIGGLSHYISPSGYIETADGRREPEWSRWERVAPRLEVARYTANLLTSSIDGVEAAPMPEVADEHLRAALPVVRDAVVDLVARYRSAVSDAPG